MPFPQLCFRKVNEQWHLRWLSRGCGAGDGNEASPGCLTAEVGEHGELYRVVTRRVLSIRDKEESNIRDLSVCSEC